jgi:hypothetical protein
MASEGTRSQEISQNSHFASFIRRRKTLNEKLDQTRVRLDNWLEEESNDLTPSSVAMLEGLLTARREALQDLIDLDDEFITFILEFKRLSERASG